MKRIYIVIIFMMFLIGVLVYACSGIRPLRKGETVRCPSCGTEFTVEQGQKAKEKTQ